MKKVFLLTLLVLASFAAKAQKYDMLTSQEAYEGLLASVEYDSTYQIIMVQAIKNLAPFTQIDFSTCKSNTWMFFGKPSDTSDHSTRMHLVYSLSGYNSVIITDLNFFPNSQDYRTLNTKYINNFGLENSVAKNTDLLKYLDENSEALNQQISLQTRLYTDTTYWIVGCYISSTNMHFCKYEPVKLELMDCTIKTPVNVHEVISNLNAKPNPAKDQITISAPVTGEAKIEFINSIGENVRSLNTVFNDEITLKTDDFIPGVYFVKLTFESKIYIQKIIVQ